MNNQYFSPWHYQALYADMDELEAVLDKLMALAGIGVMSR
jgi:hypothetical protein